MTPARDENPLAGFKDILTDPSVRREFCFMSRSWNPTRTNMDASGTSPSQIKADVLKSRAVKNVMDEILAEGSTTKLQLHKAAADMLDEIGYEREFATIRWLGYVLIKVLRKCCSGLFVNEPNVRMVKSLMASQPVVFAPTHRSYGDFILMSFVCFCFDMEMPVIAAGKDFLAMWGVGTMLRNCSAFFMRRSFGEDKLYWAIFGEYVRKLITDGNMPVEFFIEGTRSRSGKPLIPRCGFLTMTLEPFLRGLIPDTLVVPINISYDRLLEEVLFTYEHLGVPKPPESTMRLLRGLKALNENYGKIFIDFGKPISVKRYVGSLHYQLRRSMDLVRLNTVSEDVSTIIQDFAYHTVDRHKELAVLNTFNLVAAVLSSVVVVSREPFPLDWLKHEVSWLRQKLQFFGARLDKTDVESAVTIHKNLVHITCKTCVEVVDIDDSLHTAHQGPVQGDKGLAVEMVAAIIMLQIYVNPCLQYVVNPALIVVAYHACHQQVVAEDDLFSNFCFLRRLLQNEFVFYQKNSAEVFADTLEQLVELRVMKKTQVQHWALGPDRKMTNFLIDMMKPFIPGYLILCTVTKKEASTPVTTNSIRVAAQREVETLLEGSTNVHPYSLSLEMHTNGLNALKNLHALEKCGASESHLVQANYKLDRIIEQLDGMAEPVMKQYGISFVEEAPFQHEASSQ